MPSLELPSPSRRLCALMLSVALAGCTDPVSSEREPAPTIRGDSTPLLVGSGRTFSAVGPVLWSVNGIPGGSAEVGTVDADGHYVAPLLLPTAEPVAITATVAGGQASDTLRLALTPAPLEGDWYGYQPRVIRVDRTAPVLLTVHAMPPVTRVVLAYKDGREAELARRGGQLFQIAIPAAKALSLYTPGEARNHVGFIDYYAGNVRTARVNAFVNVLDADLPALRPGGAHWPIGDVASGIMGFSIAGSGAGGTFSFRIDSTAPGEYRLVPQQLDHRFNMLELYLMGLAAPAEVPGFFVFSDQNPGDRLRDGGILRGTVRKLTVDSLVAVDGPRIPAAGEAQREFRLATVVLSVGRLLTPEEMTFFSHMARRGEATVPLLYRDGFVVETGLPFTLATRGRATLTTHLGRGPTGM